MTQLTKNKTIHLFLVAVIILLGCRDDEEQFFEEVNSGINIYEGNASLSTQEALNSFALENYKVIIGDLELKGNITSLSGLIALTEIQGNLIISDTDLTTLDGLDNLNRVTGVINIFPQQSTQDIIDYCALQTLFTSGDFNTVDISNNTSFNPTVADIVQGNCSL